MRGNGERQPRRPSRSETNKIKRGVIAAAEKIVDDAGLLWDMETAYWQRGALKEAEAVLKASRRGKNNNGTGSRRRRGKGLLS
jgi:hypothetical protein